MEKLKLKERTKIFALEMMTLCENLEPTLTNQIIAKQLIRCSTSVGANYRAASRAKSQADFINKLKIVEEEADESMYFLELLEEKNKGRNPKIKIIYKEANEILAMVVASIKTARKSKLVIRHS
jgi:four helix bundle protein